MMATITLVADTNYSALSVADGDTINCNGFRLTINQQPAAINIVVNTPAKAGKVTVSGPYDLSTWSFFAGTAIMFDTAAVPVGCIIGSVTGGSSLSAACVVSNEGTILNAYGGTNVNAHGLSTNLGFATVHNAYGSTSHSAHGVNSNNESGVVLCAYGATGNGLNTNNGVVGLARAGLTGTGDGISTNTGSVDIAQGGGVIGAQGVLTNNGNVGEAIEGTVSGAYGISVNNGSVLKATGASFTGAIQGAKNKYLFVIGPEFETPLTNYTQLETIYSFGPLHPATKAALAEDVEVIELSLGPTPAMGRLAKNLASYFGE